jgi:glucosamine-6-phosphate deaminase
MDVAIVDGEQAVRLAADLFAELFATRFDAVVGLATGSTPSALYRELARRKSLGELPDLAGIRCFALDEYIGLPENHPERYAHVLAREWREPLELSPEQVRVPDTREPGLDTAGERYEADIAATGGVDLQILGLGRNGHVGFNEPGSSLHSRTRLKTLSRQTREDNARFFPSLEEVPRYCITQGLGTILAAKQVLLMAFGSAKADAVAAALEGPVSAQTPASVLQFHERVTVLLDEAAASRLQHQEEYRYAWSTRWGGARLTWR